VKLATTIHHVDTKLGIAEKVFSIDQRSYVYKMCECYDGGGIHFIGVVSRLTC